MKRKVEEQMDVVLKMEEERLLLLKENAESKEKTGKIVGEMMEIKTMMEQCSLQLQSLSQENKTLKEANANLEAQRDNLRSLNEDRKEALRVAEETKSPERKKPKQMAKRGSTKTTSGWKGLKFDRGPSSTSTPKR